MIELPQNFSPKKVCQVTHKLSDHPAFKLSALSALVERLPSSFIRFHTTKAQADTDFDKACQLYPAKMTVKDAMANLAHSGSWIAVHYANIDPEYKDVLSEVMGEMKKSINPLDPGVDFCVLWIFIQSPRSITPFHMDHENNFILQIKGTKTAHIWNPNTIIPKDKNEVFLGAGLRDQIKFKEDFLRESEKLTFEPGKGAYMPSASPHLVFNHDEISITCSFTYITKKTYERAQVCRLNHMLRRRGFSPSFYEGRGLDSAKYRAIHSLLRLRKYLTKIDDRPYWMAGRPYGMTI